MDNAEIMRVIIEQRLVAIVRSGTADDALAVARSLIAGGIRAVEVSLTTPGALSAIGQLAQEVPASVAVGAGTVLDEQSARAALAAGAQFLVAPTVVPSVINTARRAGALVIPGAATPTEMMLALESGADLVKVFPAAQWTPAGIGAVLDALPQLHLVPTGGVRVETAHEWIHAGASAVGIAGGIARLEAAELTALLTRLAGVGAAS